MSIATFIRDKTDDGRNIVRFLIDVMDGDIQGCTLSHRLAAARLLTVYGHKDAPDFIDDNTPDRDETKNGRRIWGEIDEVLRALIKDRTDDGRVICLFLIDVMEGKCEGAHVGHRVSAARELLNRAFGKTPSRPLPKTKGSNTPRRSTQKPRRKKPQTPEAAAFEARVQERIAASSAAKAEPQPDAPAPASVHPEPVEGRSIPPTQSEPTQPEFDDDLSARIFRASSRCIDPNFDPMRYATDDEYFWNYDGCDDIRCPYHGDPEDPDFYEDPNDHHY